MTQPTRTLDQAYAARAQIIKMICECDEFTRTLRHLEVDARHQDVYVVGYDWGFFLAPPTAKGLGMCGVVDARRFTSFFAAHCTAKQTVNGKGERARAFSLEGATLITIALQEKHRATLCLLLKDVYLEIADLLAEAEADHEDDMTDREFWVQCHDRAERDAADEAYDLAEYRRDQQT